MLGLLHFDIPGKWALEHVGGSIDKRQHYDQYTGLLSIKKEK